MGARHPAGHLAVEPLCLSLTHPSLGCTPQCRTRAWEKSAISVPAGSLLKCLHDPEWEVRDAVAFALGLLPDRRTVTPLHHRAHRPRSRRARSRGESTGRHRGCQAVEALMLALHDDEWAVSQAASDGWRAIGLQGEAALRSHRAERDPRKHRKLVAATLEKIGVPDEPDLSGLVRGDERQLGMGALLRRTRRRALYRRTAG